MFHMVRVLLNIVSAVVLLISLSIINPLSSQQDNQIKIDNGLMINPLGLMTSSSLRYKTPSLGYRSHTQLMLGVTYSHNLMNLTNNINQYSGSVGVFLNDEVSLELEGNYINSRNDKFDRMYYNVGFRFYTPYNVVYELKMGQSILQLGIAYSLNFNLKK